MTYPIINSQEYQLKLNPGHWNTTTLRGISELGYMQLALAAIGPSIEFWERQQYIREQRHIHLDVCGRNESKIALRTRHWQEPSELEMRSIDVKVNPKLLSRENAFLELRPTPSEQYADRALQDVEEDIHPCKIRDFARTTKIFFGKYDEVPLMQTCRDVRELFPYATLESHDNIELPKPKVIITYLVDYQYTRKEDDSRIRIEFTLDYGHHTDAYDATSLEDGEFSITLFAPNGGYSYPVDPKLQEEAEEAMDLLFTHFASMSDCVIDPDDPPILEEVQNIHWGQVFFICNVLFCSYAVYWIVASNVRFPSVKHRMR